MDDVRHVPEISVVVPVFGCAGCLHQLHRRLVASVGSITGDYELIFVDDRSEDGAWDVLRALAARDPRVRALRLSRNFGQAAAITAGLDASRGRWTVVMDCDLEEPPEAIPAFYAKALEGFDLVRGVRSDWKHGPARRRHEPRVPSAAARIRKARAIRDAEHPLTQGRHGLPRPA